MNAEKMLKKPKRNTKMVGLHERFKMSTDFELRKGIFTENFHQALFLRNSVTKRFVFFPGEFLAVSGAEDDIHVGASGAF